MLYAVVNPALKYSAAKADQAGLSSKKGAPERVSDAPEARGKEAGFYGRMYFKLT